MVQTENGRQITDALTEEGRLVIENTILENGLAAYGDAAIFSSDVGVGVDAASPVQASLTQAETGVGADAISAALSSRLESETGTGIDALVSILKVIAKFDSDTGVGTDAILEQLAALVQTETGSGAEAISASLSSRLESETGSGADAISKQLVAVLSSEEPGYNGSGNLAGPGGVTIQHNLGIANYQPEIEVTEESGAVGEIWITDIGANSFKVRNSGIGEDAFDWTIYAGTIAADHKGTDNLAGPGGVTIQHNLGIANYQPEIEVTEESGAVGEIWITDIAVSSFVVRNSGAGLETFSWIICKENVAADHRGTSNLAGPGGVTVTHNLDLAFYQLQIKLTEESGAVGEIWITDVAVNSFVVRNSGAGLAAFSWIVYDVVAGADELAELLATLSESETGAGADAISELLSSRLESDTGVGVDAFSSLVATLMGLDLGIGVDAISKLLAKITDSDSGSGVETSMIWMYILLKLLQKKGLNIELSQKTLKGGGVVVADVILDSMDATTGWNTDGAMSNITVNVTEKKEGTGALNLIKALTGSYNAGILKAISSVDLESKDVMVWLFLKDTATKNKLSVIKVNLMDSAQNGAEWHFSASSLSVGWNLLTVDTSTTPDYSDPLVDLTDITEIQLYVNTNQATDTYAEGDVIADYYHYSELEILLLKLLQDKELNIELSQEGKPS